MHPYLVGSCQASILPSQDYSKILEVDKKEKQNFSTIKKRYQKLMIKNSKDRLERIKLNKAYYQAICKVYKSQPHPLVHFINCGDDRKIINYLRNNEGSLNKKICQYPPIYYAARAGHYDIVELLLKVGCSLSFQNDRSTPMHCAAFYGHHSLIPLLLEYGLPTDIKNFSDNLPVQESATTEIQLLLQNSKLNKINELNEQILKQEIGYSMINIEKQGKIVFKKIILNKYFSKFNEHVDAFHGTKYDALFSIAKNGLKKPGEKADGKVIEQIEGHIKKGVKVNKIQNWSTAVFMSPSIYYSANPVYAQQIIVDGHETWLPVVHVKVKKGCFTEHDHTLSSYVLKENEPRGVQYRAQLTQFQLPKNSPNQNMIMRSTLSSSVSVISIIFIRKGFLEKNQDYNKTMDLLLNSPEEQKFRQQAKY